uniref:Cephalosporin hydroxylase n=1 Tax=Pithovirus LCPAC104 TaxID=2506589 RepID=A0A481Z509_9VIRU|nr:MAG: cephalosporin hydroxylase [Pithovirus LCPAC104]
MTNKVNLNKFSVRFVEDLNNKQLLLFKELISENSDFYVIKQKDTYIWKDRLDKLLEKFSPNEVIYIYNHEKYFNIESNIIKYNNGTFIVSNGFIKKISTHLDNFIKDWPEICSNNKMSVMKNNPINYLMNMLGINMILIPEIYSCDWKNEKKCCNFKNSISCKDLDKYPEKVETITNILSYYNNSKNTFSDIFQHVETLHNYARECSSVVECGTRTCVNIWGFLKAMSEKSLNGEYTKLIGIDLERSKNGNIDKLEELSKEIGVNFIFYEKSDLEIELDNIDMVFIDTWHVYGQLKRELEKFSKITNKYICMHDTTVDEFVGESVRNGWDVEKQASEQGWEWIEVYTGLWPAVVEFLQKHPEWKLEKRFTNCYGLTILKKSIIQENKN